MGVNLVTAVYENFSSISFVRDYFKMDLRKIPFWTVILTFFFSFYWCTLMFSRKRVKERGSQRKRENSFFKTFGRARQPTNWPPINARVLSRLARAEQRIDRPYCPWNRQRAVAQSTRSSQLTGLLAPTTFLVTLQVSLRCIACATW